MEYYYPVTLRLRAMDAAGHPVACVGMFSPASAIVIRSDTIPLALTDSTGRLEARVMMSPGKRNTVSLGNREYAGITPAFRVRGPGYVDFGSITLIHYPPPFPVTREYPDCRAAPK